MFLENTEEKSKKKHLDKKKRKKATEKTTGRGRDRQDVQERDGGETFKCNAMYKRQRRAQK